MQYRRILIGYLLFLILTLTSNSIFAATTIHYITIQYNTIQEAINAANPGDIIQVKQGIYSENIIVNKPLKILGENKSTTIIQANDTNVIQIIANDVYISGFTVINGDNGITVGDASNCTITDTIVFNNSIGICLERATNNLVSGNLIINNKRASIGCGIFLNDGSSKNIIKENQVLNNGEGIYVRGSDNNLVSSNFIFNNTKTGVCLMKFKSCDYNIISHNIIEEGACYGIDLWSANYNIIFNNTLKNNGAGLQVSTSNNNTMYHNNLIDNYIQIYSYDSVNIWDNGFEGNYWNDYNWTEFDLYGIGTIPYNISKRNPVNQDFFPLRSCYMKGDANHDCCINMTDADLLKLSWQTLEGESNYSPYVDFNQDKIVNILDATVVGYNWLKSQTLDCQLKC